ncbi:MAG: aquaporin [Rhodothermales bacterium]
MKKYLTEFIGTFFLVLTIGLVVASGTPFAPIAIGSALMVMIYMGGHISGAHYNPAVTLAVLMRGNMKSSEVAPYMVSQILGAFVAAAVSFVIVGDTFAPAPAADASMLGVLLVEFLFTFMLALVILNSAASKATAGNWFYGLAIGFTVTAAAFAGGGISGGAFNPAVGIGPILMDVFAGDGGFGNIWIYLVAPFAGGALAAVVFKIQEGEDLADDPDKL